MRLLIFSDEFPPLGNRRAYTLYYFLKDFAGRYDYHIDLITSSRNSNKKEMFSDNIFVHYIDLGRRGGETSLSWFEKILFSFKALKYYKKNLRKKKYDLVHYFSLFTACMIGGSIKNKFVVNIYPTDIYGRFLGIKNYFVKKTAMKSEVTITSCRADSDIMKKIVPKSNIELIYSGVRTKKFIFNLRSINKKLTLISVGRMINKGEYDFLINAMKGMNDYRLILIGDGKLQSSLEKLSIKNGVDVEFTGRLRHEEIKNIMKRSDIYISVTSVGGISNSMMEAMSMGLPVICYDVGGNKEIVTENGFIIERNNINGIRSSLDIYRNNRALIKKHGNMSKKIADGMSWKKTGEKYREMYMKKIVISDV